jgi:hypothetical protein
MRHGVARARLVLAAVKVERLLRADALGEEPGEGIGQAEVRGDLGAVVGAAEHPDLGCGVAFRVGLDGAEVVALGQIAPRDPGHQVAHVVGELGWALVGERIQREGGAAVRTGRAAEAQVDAAGSDRIQHAELLGDLEGRVVRQHHAGAADADGAGGSGDGGDQNLGRRADDGGVGVVLGHPEAVIVPAFAGLGQRHGVADRFALRAIHHGNRLIENGQAHGGEFL